MNYQLILGLGCLLTFVMCAGALAAAIEGGPDAARVREIAQAIDEKPYAVGPRITDRAAWARLAQHKDFKDLVATAERRLSEPMPPMTEELYSTYARTGQRTKEYADVRAARSFRVMLLALAECIEDKGRFIGELEKAMADICSEPTWILNAHDTKEMDNWHGRRVTVDLGSSLLSAQLAQTMALVEPRLSEQTRQLIRDNCRRRTLDPYVKAVNGGAAGMWWINADMNWNSVCHNGVIGTALAVVEDREERAWYIACAEKYSRNYLRGFGPDGYCSEGMGYWNYGFSNYIEMADMIYRVTGGKVDLYALPGALEAAMYPTKLELGHGQFPSYADCGLNVLPDPWLSSLLARHYGVALTRGTRADLTHRSGRLVTTMLYCSLRPEIAQAKVPPADALPIRSYFDKGGVLTCRPAGFRDCRMAVSLKGGHNAEDHNHNDLGSFVVMVDDEQLILDPGGEVYTARTFSKDRYQSNLLNSFGHPVPVIAGKFQRAGRDAAARVVKTDFTDTIDTFVLDLTSAYPVSELESLTRSFTYDRRGEGSLVVRDEVRAKSPATFGTALLTYGAATVREDKSLLISGKNAAVIITIDTGGVPYTLTQTVIEEDALSRAKPARIGIDLQGEKNSWQVTLTIRPAPRRQAAAQ